MGYEIAVTPLQLVTAYAAIANGGELLEPHLVKEIRNSDGKVLYKAEPRAIRRVMSGETARTVQQMLRAVVEEGTATKADLATFEVAGKSGTARRTSENAGYTTGNYTASFVGLFPGNDPQYVVLVKLDSPKGAHYAGGDIAAPVTQIILRAALAARDAALDRHDLAASERGPNDGAASSTSSGVADTRSKALDRSQQQLKAYAYDPSGNVGAVTDPPAVVVDLPSALHTTVPPSALRAVPDVRGLSIRAAVHAIHQAGFRVRLSEAPTTYTLPAAGAMTAPGTLVQLAHSPE
jgi:cell division protein FtsI (penicillin-binding protein 3)